jgi:hypothetical protein
MKAHQFRLQGAWGSRLVSIAGYRCDRCGALYFRKNLTTDPSGRIFAIDSEGDEAEIDEVEGGLCDGSD